MNQRPDDGHITDIISLMRSHDLFAVDSIFRPQRKYMFNKDKKKRVCNAIYLRKDNTQRPKKLDYFLVSNRWRSCVTNSKTNWAPSVHRFGKEFDHSLLQITWAWRVKKEKKSATKDFQSMTRANWAELNDKIVSNLSQHTEDRPTNQASDIKADTHNCLKRMNTCIQAAIQSCVPNKKRLSACNKARDIRQNSPTV